MANSQNKYGYTGPAKEISKPGARIPEAKTEIRQVKYMEPIRAADKPYLVSYLEGIVSLKPTGNYLIGRCPLPGHEDKNPSFTVNPKTQTFHCFGCGAQGDVIAFEMAYRGLFFKEAVVSLGIKTEATPIYSSRDRRKALLVSLAAVETEILYYRFLGSYGNLRSAVIRDINRFLFDLTKGEYCWDIVEDEEALAGHLPKILSHARTRDEVRAIDIMVHLCRDLWKEAQVITRGTEAEKWELFLKVLHG
jgi:hypothetical protein